MAGVASDKDREERIDMDIVVDAYNAGERAMGWYYYLQDKLGFPFTAKCIKLRAISPLRPGDIVTVVGMGGEDESEREMFVSIKWDSDTLAVPLMQLAVIDAEEETFEAVLDWNYWVDRGYEM